MKINLYNFICILTLFFKQELKYLFKYFFIDKKIADVDQKYDFFTNFSVNKKNKRILITSFLGINDYLKYEYLLGIYLSNIEKASITVLVEENDIITKRFFLK